MKKFAGRILGFVMAVALMLGGIGFNFNLGNRKKNSVNANSSWTALGGETVEHSSGNGTSTVVYNPNARGTTTLFSGSSVTANGTVAGEQMSFNVYGKSVDISGNPVDEVYAGETFSLNQVDIANQDYWLRSDGTQWIETGIQPDGNTTLRIWFKTGASISPTGASPHPDIAGSNGASGNAHFGGPLIVGTDIQFLYGSWQSDSDQYKMNTPTNIYATPGSSAVPFNADTEYRSELISNESGLGIATLEHVESGLYRTVEYNTGFNFSNPSYALKPLYVFGQNNGGDAVNPFTGAIKEVEILNGKRGAQDDVSIHLVAVPAGYKHQLALGPATENCFVDDLTGTYYYNKGRSGGFAIDAVGSMNAIEIDFENDFGGALRGVKVGSGDAYTYIDGNGDRWLSDKLEINQIDGIVNLYRYEDPTTGIDVTTLGAAGVALADQLLGMETSEYKTVLSNKQGAWMTGVIGPVINYTLTTSNTDISFPSGSTFSVLDLLNPLGKNITASTLADPSGLSFLSAKWSIGTQIDIFTNKVKNVRQTTVTASEIILSSKKLLESATEISENAYSLAIDIEFEEVPVYEVKMKTDTLLGDGFGTIMGDKTSATAVVLTGRDITITGMFNSVLYEFAGFVIYELDNDGNRGIEVTSPLYDSVETDNYDSLGRHQFTITPESNIEIVYNIQVRKYDVEILGKTTKDAEVSFASLDSIKNNFVNGDGNKVWYKATGTKMQITGISNLETERTVQNVTVPAGHFVQASSVMFYNENCVYEFSHFELNGKKITGSSITIDENALVNNPGLSDPMEQDNKFVIHAVYQKKFVVNVEFTFNGNTPAGTNSFTPLSTEGDVQPLSAGIVALIGQGYSINEGETATIVLRPDKRYDVTESSTISGIDSTARISPNELPQILVTRLDQSYNITVGLEHRNISVSLSVKPRDAGEEFSGSRYVNVNGTQSMTGSTTVSAESAAKAVKNLTHNGGMLGVFNYRFDHFEILNTSGNWVSFNGNIDARANIGGADFFDFVSSEGVTQVRMVVVQQYFVNLSTPGFSFEQNGNTATFTHSDLGSYTATFANGQFTSNGDGTYMVDYGTEITLTQTAGQYGNFLHYTGLNDGEENLISVFGDRQIGINFESTKLAPWIMPTIISGSGLLLILALMSVYLVMRARKLNAQKLAREAEIRDMKRKFNISDEISKLRAGDYDSIPQTDLKQRADVKMKQAEGQPAKASAAAAVKVQQASTPATASASAISLEGCSILPDKSIVDKAKKKVASLQQDGTILDANGKPFAKANFETGKITDNANKVIGTVQGDGSIKK